MTKILKITFNLAIFIVVIGFIRYMIAHINDDASQNSETAGKSENTFVSPYKQVASFRLPDEINRFDLHDDKLYISAGQSVYIFDTEGNQLGRFPAGKDVRDIRVSIDEIYLLYSTRIAVFSLTGQHIRQWEACSGLSDYCSFTISGNEVFVTDAANKNICKYTTEGNFVKFIKSPVGFIIPSYSFDIDHWNDTIYCVNSGRHLVEIYKPDGVFIGAFGDSGVEAGSFAGCCNPSFITFTSDGTMITSEKGTPRISCFERNGKFQTVLLNSKMLGGGSRAYHVRVFNNKLFVAGKNKISTFQYWSDIN